MQLEAAIDSLERGIEDPRKGLPESVFQFVSRVTPMVNVDLLIRNPEGQTLLTWRDDEFHSPGWHIPGGIIRFKETIEQRIAEVARIELRAEVDFGRTPVAISQIVLPGQNTRGHFVSLLYECRLLTCPDRTLECTSDMPTRGQWKWHAACPKNLVDVHAIYREFFQK